MRPLMAEIEIWRAAEQMQKRFGADASVQAGVLADQLLDQGDATGFQIWNRIIATINLLDQKRPPNDKPTH